MTYIPFGKPFPAIDSVSLRDGVAAGLVNGFINELKDYEKVPGHTLFGGYPSPDSPPDPPTPPPPPPPPPPPVPGVARHFGGGQWLGAELGPSDFLLTNNSSSSYNDMTIIAWVKRDYLGTRNGIIGRLFGPNSGWALFVDENNLLTFFSDGNPPSNPQRFSTVECPDLTDWHCLAMSYNASASSPQLRFYAGPTVDTIVEIGTANKQGGFSELAAYGICIGWVNDGDQQTLRAWNGSIDEISVWTGNGSMSLEDIKARAECGANSTKFPSGYKLIANITGESPEPLFWAGTPILQSMTVVGTTVVDGILCSKA